MKLRADRTHDTSVIIFYNNVVREFYGNGVNEGLRFPGTFKRNAKLL